MSVREGGISSVGRRVNTHGDEDVANGPKVVWETSRECSPFRAARPGSDDDNGTVELINEGTKLDVDAESGSAGCRCPARSVDALFNAPGGGIGRSYDGKDLPISTSFELKDPACRRVVLVLPRDFVGRDRAIGTLCCSVSNGEKDGGAEAGISSGLGLGILANGWGLATEGRR